MKEAKLIKNLSKNFTGEARLYELNKSIGYTTLENNKFKKRKTKFVIVSATDAMFSGPETYVFPADNNGNILDWGELDGSFRGEKNCDLAIENMGFKIIKET